MNEKSFEKAAMKGYLKATGIISGITIASYAVVYKAYTWYSKKIDASFERGKEFGKLERRLES